MMAGAFSSAFSQDFDVDRLDDWFGQQAFDLLVADAHCLAVLPFSAGLGILRA